mmetsp:Transcript_27304/g.61923  ORF Transcript_27304/g.61923 Transcript_27304/m.61923 type:complete len:381 (-) Transcript_27304:454-1596(-)
MEILVTVSYSGIRPPTMACPASWKATSSMSPTCASLLDLSMPTVTRSIAQSTSSHSITSFSVRAAWMAASFSRFFSAAPARPGVRRATCSRSTSGARGLLRACTLRMSTRPLKSGTPISILRSKRPARTRASSRMSTLFVAAMVITPWLPSKPSISTSSWFRVFSRSSLPPEDWPPPRLRPTASISSMKRMQGAASLASLNRSRTREGPTPTNISTKSEPEMEKKGTLASPAVALASSVFPVPGGPQSSAPLGIFAPRSVNFLGSLRNCTNSIISLLASSQPATSLKVVVQVSLFARLALDLPTCPNIPPGPPAPPAAPFIMNAIAPMSIRVGRNLSASEPHEVSFTYTTGMKSRWDTPRAVCASSILRSNDSTVPMLKW